MTLNSTGDSRVNVKVRHEPPVASLCEETESNLNCRNCFRGESLAPVSFLQTKILLACLSNRKDFLEVMKKKSCREARKARFLGAYEHFNKP